MCYHFAAGVAIFLQNSRVPKIVCEEFAYELTVAIIKNPQPHVDTGTDDCPVKIYRNNPTFFPLADIELLHVVMKADVERSMIPYSFTLNENFTTKVQALLQQANPELESRSSLVIPEDQVPTRNIYNTGVPTTIDSRVRTIT